MDVVAIVGLVVIGAAEADAEEAEAVAQAVGEAHAVEAAGISCWM